MQLAVLLVHSYLSLCVCLLRNAAGKCHLENGGRKVQSTIIVSEDALPFCNGSACVQATFNPGWTISPGLNHADTPGCAIREARQREGKLPEAHSLSEFLLINE